MLVAGVLISELGGLWYSARQSRKLWLINSGCNLASFVLAGLVLAVWR